MTRQSNFLWTSDPVSCYNPALRKGDYIFYTSFTINNQPFIVGDFAICDESSKVESKSPEVCRLLCVYESLEKRHAKCKYKGLVRRFTWARNTKQFATAGNIPFDEDNEVVDDADRGDLFINLQHITQKCYVIFATVSDPVHLIALKNLDKQLYFSCRYTLKRLKLVPNFTDDCITDLNVNEYTPISHKLTKIHSASPRKNKYCDIDDDHVLSETPTPSKKICYRNTSTAVTDNRLINSVKRNLNVSFGDSQLDECSPSISYSIIQKENINSSPLKLRLMKMSNDHNPVVVLDQLDFESTALSPSKLSQRKLRPRKPSIAHETTPSGHRRRRRSPDLNYEPTVVTKTPRTPSRSSTRNRKVASSIYNFYDESWTTSTEESSPTKRKIKPSTRYSDDMYLSPTKSLKITAAKRKVARTPSRADDTPSSSNRIRKLIRDGVITPSVQSRKNAVARIDTPLMRARSKLHVSFVPTDLPCREKERADIMNFLQGKLLDKCGGCMYISGVPGTGKTATTTSVINYLLGLSKSGDLPQFDYVSINGMKLTEPRQAYVEILKQLTGKTVAWEQAQTMLNERFTKSKKKQHLSHPVVLLVDELDIICTKRQDVVYNLLDWPTKPNAQLIVVTIANTMDLPERLLMSRVTSRLGLTRLTFQAYTHKQLQEIVTKRLAGINSFNPDAIQFVARKVASVSGDARRALDICRRSAEIAEAASTATTLVTMVHVNEALKAMLTQPKVRAIKHCSHLEKLLLQAVVAEVERTGVEETTFVDVYKMLTTVAALDGFQMVTSTVALGAVAKLSTCRLLLNDQKCSDINQRIILNISSDDIYYALNATTN